MIDLIERLKQPLTLSMFLNISDLAREALAQREEAASSLSQAEGRIKELEHTVARQHRQIGTTRRAWLRAAESALADILGASNSTHPAHDLWLRVEMAKEPPVEIAESSQLMTGEKG